MSGVNVNAATKALVDAQMNRRLEPDLKKLKKSTDAMEAAFFKQLLQTMRKSVPKVKVGDDTGADMYQDMMDQAVADGASKKGSLGLGEMLYKQLSDLVIGEEKARMILSARAAASNPTSQPPTQDTKS